MSNIIMAIEPYWYMDTWLFDDESEGLDKEPFVQGVPEMIDTLVRGIPNARNGFRLFFSSKPFSGYQEELIQVREEYGGYWYLVKDRGVEGCLCPALFKYIDTPPESIYVKAEPSSKKHKSHESSEVAILKDRIEKLERLVGKLTLENEFLKRERNNN